MWFSFCKSQTFGKRFETFSLQIFFLRVWKSIDWYGFSMNFWLFWMCFINVLFKVITNLKFYKRCFIKDDLLKHFCIIGGVLCTKEIHRLGPMDLKIYSLERNPRLWLNSWQSLETFAKIISVTSTSRKVSSSRGNKLQEVHTFFAVVLLGPAPLPSLFLQDVLASLSVFLICTAVTFIGRAVSKSRQPTTTNPSPTADCISKQKNPTANVIFQWQLRSDKLQLKNNDPHKDSHLWYSVLVYTVQVVYWWRRRSDLTL